jgi:oxalate decarboxylase/phosphoglucose isomerase-like protein (cupin superfamily)
MEQSLFSLAAARVAPLEPGRRSPLLLRHGSMSLRFYAPRQTDPQTPHDQDEIYVVQTGSGYFLSGPSEGALQRQPFGPGDAIFVPAGFVHRFVDFTPDFGTWVVFWGPVGGEKD